MMRPLPIDLLNAPLTDRMKELCAFLASEGGRATNETLELRAYRNGNTLRSLERRGLIACTSPLVRSYEDFRAAYPHIEWCLTDLYYQTYARGCVVRTQSEDGS